MYLKVYELHESDTATRFYRGSHEDTMIQLPTGKLYPAVRRVRGSNPCRSYPFDTTCTYYLKITITLRGTCSAAVDAVRVREGIFFI